MPTIFGPSGIRKATKADNLPDRLDRLDVDTIDIGKRLNELSTRVSNVQTLIQELTDELLREHIRSLREDIVGLVE